MVVGKVYFSRLEVTAGISAVCVLGGRAAGAVAVLCDVGRPVGSLPSSVAPRGGFWGDGVR
ncbi:hypothetical protein MF406_03080 [Georgenia sp. TF02-10]|uniref:hypothetical protein n=1 Tax=Georgenia sp. TF02-10 TaxID=2917725 RepID=UPI001FA7B855|nr:hypothetical protein [Georgenia sp. TF02-10]UNX55273.1 hypothetical protein MF406_03080 [Georgenia sp. TF02-10]